MLFTDLRFYESRGGSSDFWLQNFQLQTSDFGSSNFGFLTVQTQSWMARPSDLPLPTSHFSLPTSDFWLPTSDFRLLISHFPLPTSDFPLLISNFRVLTSDFWLDSFVRFDCRSIHHAGINAQSQSSVERTAVPFSPQKRTTKLALEKATKHKANPATDEVRLENRNHGLAWSQSGNNKTVQTLAVNLILACLTGALRAKRGERGILREARNECESLRS